LNIVFDFGRVIFTWESHDLVAKHFSDPASAAHAHHCIFEHPDWSELDRGTISLDEAARRGAGRLGLPVEKITPITSAVPAALVPIPASIDLVRRVKAHGNAVYALSNMGTEAMEHLERSYDFFGIFDGMVISSRINLVKPEAAIYRYLLDRYHLDPLQTVFIDDYRPNLEAAARFGIRTIQFTSTAQCEQELVKMGVL
jgi:putative hydrolase of the HAD superfamily